MIKQQQGSPHNNYNNNNRENILLYRYRFSERFFLADEW